MIKRLIVIAFILLAGQSLGQTALLASGALCGEVMTECCCCQPPRAGTARVAAFGVPFSEPGNPVKRIEMRQPMGDCCRVSSIPEHESSVAPPRSPSAPAGMDELAQRAAGAPAVAPDSGVCALVHPPVPKLLPDRSHNILFTLAFRI